VDAVGDGDAVGGCTVPPGDCADAEGGTDFEDIHAPIGYAVIGLKAVLTDILQNQFPGLFAKDIGGVAPVEVKAKTHPVRFPARAFIADVFRVVSVFRGDAQKVNVVEGAADVLALYPFAAESGRKLGVGARGVNSLLNSFGGIAEDEPAPFPGSGIEVGEEVIGRAVAVVIAKLDGQLAALGGQDHGAGIEIGRFGPDQVERNRHDFIGTVVRERVFEGEEHLPRILLLQFFFHLRGAGGQKQGRQEQRTADLAHATLLVVY